MAGRPAATADEAHACAANVGGACAGCEAGSGGVPPGGAGAPPGGAGASESVCAAGGALPLDQGNGRPTNPVSVMFAAAKRACRYAGSVRMRQ